MHVMSPMSNRSGSNTPVQVAPIVPSMLPVAQKTTASQNAPMDTLNALRSHKASLAVSVAQATDGPTTQEARVLKAQLRAAQIQDAKLRSDYQKLESQLKRFEALPAQLAALKDLVEQQQQTAAKGPSPEDMETRLSALENAKPAVETSQFMELQSDVRAMKTETKKLDYVPEQLRQLQATVTQHGKEIAEASSENDKLKTEVDDLAPLKEDVKSIRDQQEQRQAMRGDAVRNMAQSAIQPEIARWEAYRTEQERIVEDISTRVKANQRTIEDMSTAVEASRRTSDELKEYNLPTNLVALKDKISQVKSNEARTHNKTETLEANLTKLRKDHKNLYKDIEECIGPIGAKFADKDDTIIQRLVYLEDKSRSLWKEPDHLSSEHDRTSYHTDKQPIDPEDLKDLQEIICSLGEEKEKLVKDVQEIKVVISELQHKSQTDFAQQVHTNLLDEHKKLSERVTKLEAAPRKSASPAPSASHSQFKEVVESLRKSQKSLRGEHNTIISQIKAFENEQVRLSKEHNTLVNQIKASENKQARLSKEYNAIVAQVNKYHDEQVSLHSQQKTYQTEQDKLSEEQGRLKKASENLESRVTAFDKIVDQVKVLANAQTELFNQQHDACLRVTALEIAPMSAASQSQTVRNEHVDTLPNSPKIDGLEQRLRSVEDHIGGAGGLSTRCDKLQNDIGEVKEDIEDCQSNVDIVQKSIIGIFGEIFDPFKAWVEERFKDITQNLIQTREILASLQSKVEESERECPAATFSAPQLALIHNMVQGATEVKQDLSCLRDSVHMEAEQRNAAVEDLKQQVAMKQDVATATQAIDVVKAAVRNLQNQYDNISTDDLHQKMVHWFMQNYNSTPANMLQQFAAIQHEVTQLRKFTDVVTRIPNGVQTLGTLAQLGPQLTALVQSPPAPKESLEKLAKTNESLRIMGDSVAKAHRQHDSLAKVVGNLQTSMHSLNSNITPFVRAESLATLEKSITTLRAELKAGLENELRARREFETKASNEHDQRVHAEAAIKTSIQDLSKKLEKEIKERGEAEQDILSISNEKLREFQNGQIKTASDQVERLQKAFDQTRADFEKALNDFNDPKNKELFEWLPKLFLHVGQLQWVLEDLNQNLPKGGLEIEWTSDWKDKFSVPSPFPDSGGAAGKSKGKR